MGDHLVANEEAIKILAMNDDHVEKIGEDGRFPKRERRPSREW